MTLISWLLPISVGACMFQGYAKIVRSDFARDLHPEVDDLEVVGYGPSGTDARYSQLRADEVGKMAYNQDEPPLNCSSDYVLVFSLGKAATETFHAALQAYCGWGAPFTPQTRQSYPSGIKTHELQVEVARDFTDKLPPHSKVWIIAFTRNPFERLISRFFFMYGHELIDAKSGMKELFSQFESDLTEELDNKPDGEVFWREFEEISYAEVGSLARNMARRVNENHRHLALLNIESHSHRQIQRCVMVLRMEDAESWPSILTNVMPGFAAAPTNTAGEHRYSDMYHEFLSQYKYSDDTANNLLKSRSLRFYDLEETRSMMGALTNLGNVTRPIQGLDAYNS